MRYLTSGESHGRALVGILEGIPAGFVLDLEFLQNELKRRKIGYGRGDRQKIEADRAEILSGVRDGKTLGSPISILIWNQDWENWKDIMKVEAGAHAEREVTVPRPGHADWPGAIKYQHSDMRNVLERASARETTMRVAIGAIAKSILLELGVKIYSRVVEIGSVKDSREWNPVDDSSRVEASAIRFADTVSEARALALITEARDKGETLGGVFEVSATGVPLGLGSYVQWDRKLDGQLASAFMSLNAIKGVEVGLGFETARRWGSEAHDEMSVSRPLDGRVEYRTNRAGGLAAGVSTGEPILIRAAMKPLATLKTPLESFSVRTGKSEKAHYERSDVCAVPSAAVIGESLMALVLLENILIKFGGDSRQELLERVTAWQESRRRLFDHS